MPAHAAGHARGVTDRINGAGYTAFDGALPPAHHPLGRRRRPTPTPRPRCDASRTATCRPCCLRREARTAKHSRMGYPATMASGRSPRGSRGPREWWTSSKPSCLSGREGETLPRRRDRRRPSSSSREPAVRDEGLGLAPPRGPPSSSASSAPILSRAHRRVRGLRCTSGRRSRGHRCELAPADLTTHGVIVGMTGSGKTGLGIVLLEEALAAGIPTLIIDPKGDMGNLAAEGVEIYTPGLRGGRAAEPCRLAFRAPDALLGHRGRDPARRDRGLRDRPARALGITPTPWPAASSSSSRT